MKSAKLKSLVTVIAIAAVIIMALCVSFSGVETNATFWALVPPIVAIALALITKEVYSSLFVGVLTGAILASAETRARKRRFNPGMSGTNNGYVIAVIDKFIVCFVN